VTGDSARRWLLATREPLAQRYDVALVDLDGVVYIGPDAIPGAAEALAKVSDAGMRCAFVTNNASRSPEDVAEHLRALGVRAAPADVVTSSQAAARLVRDRLGPDPAVLVTGSTALRAAVAAAGLRTVSSADERPDAVVQGYDAGLRYADLAEAALAVRAGALWVATNGDPTLPSRRGLLPGNGSLVALVATATGASPVIAGKPQLPLHAEAVRRTGAQRPLVVGDRLDTDIEGANVAGSDSLLVLTGVTTPADLVRAAPPHRPTYVSRDLVGMLEPQPQVEVEGTGATCAGWRATGPNTVRLDGSGDPVDGLRAVLALAWSGPIDAEQLDARDALARLRF
jgi:glycerol-1-phosphatase